MTPEEFKNLSRGDLVTHKSGGNVIIISNNYGEHVTGVVSYDITNPTEWDLVLKANYKKDKD